MSPIAGPLYDYIKVYKVISFVNAMLIMLMIVMIIIAAPDNCNDEDVSNLYDVLFIIINGIFACSYMGSTVILTKLVDDVTRGTILTLMGFFGAIAQTIFLPLNKTMYDQLNYLPLLVATVIYLIVTLVIFSFGITGKLVMKKNI